MSIIGVAFDILGTQQVAPIGHRKTSGHIAFDVKIDFTRKARWELDGHKKASPEEHTCAGVVFRGSTRIAFTCGA